VGCRQRLLRCLILSRSLATWRQPVRQRDQERSARDASGRGWRHYSVTLTVTAAFSSELTEHWAGTRKGVNKRAECGKLDFRSRWLVQANEDLAYCVGNRWSVGKVFPKANLMLFHDSLRRELFNDDQIACHKKNTTVSVISASCYPLGEGVGTPGEVIKVASRPRFFAWHLVRGVHQLSCQNWSSRHVALIFSERR
jgi:hypothetical protein